MVRVGFPCFERDLDGFSVGYLTIEDRRKRNVVGEVADELKGLSKKETLAVTFIKRSYTGFRDWSQDRSLENRCEVLVDSERDVMPMIEFST